ncbi:MAG: DUF6077 domain-containing protein [Lachnospiraceae bacterium]|nr:DUF6077 domain-containing protein [Lachnospiraceae bacterium]
MFLSIIWAIGVVALNQLFLPYLIGKRFQLKEHSAIVWGNVFQFAIFYLLCEIMFVAGKTPGDICRIWNWMVIAATVVLIVYTAIKREWNIPSLKSAVGFVGAVAIISLVTVMIHMRTIPTLADMTIENLVIQMKCNAIDYMNPYTKELLVGVKDTRISPLLVYYQMLCSLTDLSPTVMINYVVSCAILLHCYWAYKVVAETFFGEKRTQTVFLFSVGLIYISFMFKSDVTDALKLLTTSWNGVVYWTAFILPLLFVTTVEPVCDRISPSTILKKILRYIALMLAGQLLAKNGIIIGALCLIIYMMLLLLRRLTGVIRKS